MPCPFHNYLRRNTQRKYITDKHSATSVCAKQGVFRCNFVNALITSITSLTYWPVKTCQLS